MARCRAGQASEGAKGSGVREMRGQMMGWQMTRGSEASRSVIHAQSLLLKLNWSWLCCAGPDAVQQCKQCKEMPVSSDCSSSTQQQATPAQRNLCAADQSMLRSVAAADSDLEFSTWARYLQVPTVTSCRPTAPGGEFAMLNCQGTRNGNRRLVCEGRSCVCTVLCAACVLEEADWAKRRLVVSRQSSVTQP